jgi:hypothetical protein
MKTLSIIAMLMIINGAIAESFPAELTGEVQTDYRYFSDPGAYGNDRQHNLSVVLEPQYTQAWDNDRSVITVNPFMRLDNIDEERSHFDIRELSYVSSLDTLEIRAGVSKVFWGTTESVHLVDVINQTDLIENPDGEQKLGQPMLNTTLVTVSGNVDLFVLPYFRERTFSGEQGRYRGQWVVDVDAARYTHEDGQNHFDYALRWSAYWKDLEWALSYFTGTDRDPVLVPDDINNRLIPVYGQVDQVGVEIQYISDDLLVKLEAIHKSTDIIDDYTASVAGFEYTFYSLYQRLDVGVLYEWIYDSRGRLVLNGLSDASFIGSRIAINDEQSSEILLGFVVDNQTGDMSFLRLESSRRLRENLSMALEINVIGEPPVASVPGEFRDDDYIQLSTSYYF